MIEKTLMGMPTLRCGLVIWLHELIFVWWFYRLIFVWCMSIPISQYPRVTWGVYLGAELRQWSLTSTDSLDNPLCFSGTHRSTVQRGKLQVPRQTTHMPWAAGLPMLVLDFQMPLRTDLKTMSERKSRSLDVLLQALKVKNGLFFKVKYIYFLHPGL